MANLIQPIQWDDQGPYRVNERGVKQYLAPAIAAQEGKFREGDDPSADARLMQWATSHGATPEGTTSGYDDKSQSFLHNRPEWNPETGAWDQSINWNNILDIVAGGEIGVGAGSAFAGGGAAAESGTGAATTGGTGAAAGTGTAAAVGSHAAAGAGMGLSGKDIIDLILGGGSIALDGINGANQQKRQSFNGQHYGGLDLSPASMVGQGATQVGRWGQSLTDLASQPIELPGAYAQQPGTYTGGGLPMPIGLSGMDPALSDPQKYLTMSGVTNRNPFGELGNQAQGDPLHGVTPPPPGQAGGGNAMDVPAGTVAMRPPGGGRDLMNNDSSQALAALQLLGMK